MPQHMLPQPGNGNPIYWRGLHIGDLTRDGTWRKAIDPRRHWCRKHDAPGIQAEPWDALRDRGAVRQVEVLDRRSLCVFRLNAEDFEANAVRDVLNPTDGEQLFVPRPNWQVEYPDGHQYQLPL